jgi:hypothetical protein
MIEKIISGGQTGADRAALDVAIELGIPHGGWIPKGRKTEEGRLSDEYHLLETTSIDYAQRTELNIADSDGTLILSHGPLAEGSALTQDLARKHRRPCLHIDLSEMDDSKASEIINMWMETRQIKVLNVAGPRASSDPKIYEAARRILKAVIELYLPHTIEEALESITNELTLKEKTAIAHIKENESSSLLLSLGMDIGRRFGLRSVNKRLLESCRLSSGDKDMGEGDASALIARELWKRLRETHGLRAIK